MRRVVITGLGIVSCLGNNQEEVHQSLLNSKSPFIILNDVGDGSGEMGDNLHVVDLGTGRTAIAISAGDSHNCAILDNASVKCWGERSNCRLRS